MSDDRGSMFEALVDDYIDKMGVGRAIAIEKVADSAAGRDLLLRDREAAPMLNDVRPALTGEALRAVIEKRRFVEDLLDAGARDLQARSDPPLEEGEALRQFLCTRTGRTLYELLVMTDR